VKPASLSRLLELRRVELQERAAQVGAAQRNLAEARARLADLDAAVAGARARTPRTAGDAEASRRYVERLSRERAGRQARVEQATAAAHIAEAALAEARAELEALERHDERSRESERALRGRHEANEQDDLVSGRRRH